MPRLHHLHSDIGFPPSSAALDNPNGLLAVGGELSAPRLLAAYRRGIFPWYEAPQPVLWWTPDPRSILLPESLHVSRSLKKTLAADRYRLAVDQQFTTVMHECARLRRNQAGTWIDADMINAYGQLHQLGVAHSIEVSNTSGTLVGGLYGIAIGRVFFGESMFSRETDTSKIALVALVSILCQAQFHMIDCQVESDHMNSMGARNVSRLDFEQRLAQTIDVEPDGAIWQLPANCGDLL